MSSFRRFAKRRAQKRHEEGRRRITLQHPTVNAQRSREMRRLRRRNAKRGEDSERGRAGAARDGRYDTRDEDRGRRLPTTAGYPSGIAPYQRQADGNGQMGWGLPGRRSSGCASAAARLPTLHRRRCMLPQKRGYTGTAGDNRMRDGQRTLHRKRRKMALVATEPVILQEVTTRKKKLPNLPNLPKYTNGFFEIVRGLGA